LNQEKSNNINPTNASKAYIEALKDQIIDKQASILFDDLKWIELEGISQNNTDLYPIVFTGKGEKVLLLHGFDSCFLEYRRLTPLLKNTNSLIIPDLYGFGFCPRSNSNKYGFQYLMKHLNSILKKVSGNDPIGIIGASMGGALALELARQNPRKSVGPAEEQIASIHLKVPGWQSSLAEFASKGGVSNCGVPKPTQPLKIILGKHDRIIPKNEKRETNNLYSNNIEIASNSGHLPHLEEPKFVAETWEKFK